MGDKYRYSGAARLSVASDFVWVGVKFENASGGVIQQTQVRVLGTAYAPFNIEFTVPAGAAIGYVYIWKGGGSGYVYLDDVALR